MISTNDNWILCCKFCNRILLFPYSRILFLLLILVLLYCYIATSVPWLLQELKKLTEINPHALQVVKSHLRFIMAGGVKLSIEIPKYYKEHMNITVVDGNYNSILIIISRTIHFLYLFDFLFYYRFGNDWYCWGIVSGCSSWTVPAGLLCKRSAIHENDSR